MRLQDLDDHLLPVLCGHCQRRLALGVGLVDRGASLEQVLHQLLPAIAGCIVQAAVARGVHRVGVGAAVEEELDHGDAVGADGVAEGRDALVVLRIQRLLLAKEVLDGLEVAVLRSLVEGQRCLVQLLDRRLQLLGQAAHLLAELQHQLLVLVVLHGGLQSVLLDVVQDGRELWVALQCLDAVLDGGVVARELLVVVLRDGLGLEPSAHGLRVLGELL
mmetsp:Transcript_97342/g.284379  ORF Transcript_97342/g.284379 Transcript_97342/m.284379 type:complete len:218 (+) Transcript_97342:502-1155(+)